MPLNLEIISRTLPPPGARQLALSHLHHLIPIAIKTHDKSASNLCHVMYLFLERVRGLTPNYHSVVSQFPMDTDKCFSRYTKEDIFSKTEWCKAELLNFSNWYSGSDESMLWVAVLSVVGCLSVSLASIRYVSGEPLQLWHLKVSPDTAQYFPGATLVLAENHWPRV